jgi:serine O-acetyltransferase
LSGAPSSRTRIRHAVAGHSRAARVSDIQAAFTGDPAAQHITEILLCYPGVWAMTHHRLAHALHRLGVPLLARFINEIAHSATGIDIHPGATIGPSFFIDHGTGVVIGETAIIGERVRVYQAVTLGAKSFAAGSTVRSSRAMRGIRWSKTTS